MVGRWDEESRLVAPSGSVVSCRLGVACDEMYNTRVKGLHSHRHAISRWASRCRDPLDVPGEVGTEAEDVQVAPSHDAHTRASDTIVCQSAFFKRQREKGEDKPRCC